MMMTEAEFAAITHEIERLAGGGGWADKDGLRAVKAACARLRGISGAIDYELGSIEGWAERLFSARKHQQWGTDGAERIRGFILNDASKLRMIYARVLRPPASFP